MKICPVRAEFHVGGRIDRHDEANSGFAVLRTVQKTERGKEKLAMFNRSDRSDMFKKQ
jgi:hypothetical protein